MTTNENEIEKFEVTISREQFQLIVDDIDDNGNSNIAFSIAEKHLLEQAWDFEIVDVHPGDPSTKGMEVVFEIEKFGFSSQVIVTLVEGNF